MFCVDNGFYVKASMKLTEHLNFFICEFIQFYTEEYIMCSFPEELQIIMI